MTKRFILSLLISLSFNISAFAKPDIELKLDSKKVVIKNQKEELMDASQAKPGDVLLYTITVLNKGTSKAVEVEPEGDIPKNTVYIPEKIDPKYSPEFSVDGGKTYSAKPKIKEKVNGKEITKEATIDKYNKIKWLIKSLDPKKSIIFTYKVKVK
ncbi:MAG: hypothetical protein U0457_20290 [Candidatus Sericytochromatia bacterium]